MKSTVIGATGGSGKAAVERALEAGHEVTAFSRRATAMDLTHPRLRKIDGDATRVANVERAVAGRDAVIVTLGITENPLRVRLLGPARTPLDVRSRGTQTVIEAMQRCGVRRLIVQSSYGVGPTRDRLGLADRLLFSLLLAPQIADTEVQEQAVAASDLDWVLLQPVHLTDDDDDPRPHVSVDGAVGAMNVSRRSVGRFLVEAAERPELVRQSLALSGPVA